MLADTPALAVTIDSFEQRLRRPKDRGERDRWYSGKKNGPHLRLRPGRGPRPTPWLCIAPEARPAGSPGRAYEPAARLVIPIPGRLLSTSRGSSDP